jgi:hypothetical protein
MYNADENEVLVTGEAFTLIAVIVPLGSAYITLLG